MIQFKKAKLYGSWIASVDGIERFEVMESESFAGGWILYTLKDIKIDDFATLAEVEQYIEEMDK